MALRMSTGLCNKLHDTNPSRSVFNLGFLYVFAGTPPATADLANSNPVIVTVSNNGSPTLGLTFEVNASGGTLPKKAAEVWSGTIASGGPFTATHFRLCEAGDNGLAAATPTTARVQGLIGTGGNVDMVVGNQTLSSGALFTINYAALSFVPS